MEKNKKIKCQICKKHFDSSEMYEYRGFLACEKHFDELCEKVDYQRTQVIETTKKINEGRVIMPVLL